MEFLKYIQRPTTFVDPEETIKKMEMDAKKVITEKIDEKLFNEPEEKKNDEKDLDSLNEPLKNSSSEPILKEPIDEDSIEEATDVNVEIQSSYIEAPLLIWNFFLSIMLKKKVRKKYTDPKVLSEKLKEVKQIIDENEKDILISESEAVIMRGAARRKAIKEKGKVREGARSFSFFMRALAKRLGVFIMPDI